MKATVPTFFKTVTRAESFKQWLPITAVLLLATLLYLYQLATESLWLDEIFSLRDANQPVADILETNRPLYYLLLKLWMQLSQSDAWLRSLSVVFSLGSIFLTYQLGCQLVGRGTGLIAALVLALSPLTINHAQEVRMYMVGVFFGLAGTLALAAALQRPTHGLVRWWAGMRLLTMLTAPLNFTLLIPDLLLVGLQFRHQRRFLVRFGRWLLILGLLWLPFLIRSAQAAPEFSTGWVAELLPRPTPLTVIGTFEKFATGSVTPPFGLQLWIYQRFFDLLGLGLIGLLGVAFWRRKSAERLFWVAAWALLPLAALFALCYLYSPIWLDRYLLFTAPYVLIWLAAGFTKLWHWRRGLALLVVLAYGVAVGGELAEYYTLQNRQDWRGVAQMIQSEDRPGDVIGVASEDRRLAVAHYYQGAAAIQVMTVPTQTPQLPPPQLAAQMLQSLPANAPRFWLVLSGVGDQHQRQIFEAEIGKRYQIQSQKLFAGDIELVLATPPGRP
jgi:mannosyltransferase